MILDGFNRHRVIFDQRKKILARKSCPKSTTFNPAIVFWSKRLCNSYIVTAELSRYALIFFPVSLDDEISHRTIRKGLWLAFIKLSLNLLWPKLKLESCFYEIICILKLIHVVHFLEKGWFGKFEIVNSGRVLYAYLKVVFQLLYRMSVYLRWPACLNKWNQLASIQSNPLWLQILFFADQEI